MKKKAKVTFLTKEQAIDALHDGFVFFCESENGWQNKPHEVVRCDKFQNPGVLSQVFGYVEHDVVSELFDSHNLVITYTKLPCQIASHVVSLPNHVGVKHWQLGRIYLNQEGTPSADIED